MCLTFAYKSLGRCLRNAGIVSKAGWNGASSCGACGFACGGRQVPDVNLKLGPRRLLAGPKRLQSRGYQTEASIASPAKKYHHEIESCQK